MSAADAAGLPPELLPFVVPVVAARRHPVATGRSRKAVRMAQIEDGPDVAGLAAQAAPETRG